MTNFTITEVAVPQAGAAADWRIEGAAAVSDAIVEEVLGNTDLAESAAMTVVSLEHQKNYAKHLFVATATNTPDGVPSDILGTLWVYASVRDNLHLAMADVSVLPEARNQGLGSALWDTAVAKVRELGRTTLITSSGHANEPAEDAPEALSAPTGSGRISRADAGAAFALKRGLSLEQVERHSVLEFPVDAEVLESSWRKAEEAAGSDYRIVLWRDAVPQEWMEQYCILQTRMSTDAPSAGLEYQEETWDAERVETIRATLQAAGKHTFVAAALHVPTGTLAGFTELETVPDKPHMVYQQNTIVLKEHRGHKLGMLVKVANLRHLAEAAPEVQRIHTWNAEENSFMLNINVALGFRQASVWGEWQLKLS